MSWIAGWFGGSSAPPAAGAPAAGRRSFSSSAEDTWRKLYAPGSNPNMNHTQYYDNVKDKASEPSTWDYIIKSEAARSKSFDAERSNNSGSPRAE